MSNNGKALAALAEIEQYFLNRQDVVDGDYGIPEPNEEMRMLQEVEIIKAALSSDCTAAQEKNHASPTE